MKSFFTKKKEVFLVCLILAAFLFSWQSSVTMSRNSGIDPKELQKPFSESYKSEADGKVDAAIKAIKPVQKKYPDDYDVNMRMGWLNYSNGAYEESAGYYGKAIKTAPNSIEAPLGYLLPLLALQKYDQVETVANEILEKDDNNYYASIRLAIALRSQEKYDEAEELDQSMLELYPTDVSFMAELAAVKYAQGDMAAAENLYSRILIFDPTNQGAVWFFSEGSK